MTINRTAWLVLAALTEPGNREIGTMTRTAGPLEALERLRDGTGLSPRLAETVRERLQAIGMARALDVNRIADEILDTADRYRARLVTPADAEWPSALDDLATNSDLQLKPNTDRPMCLWLRGPLDLAEAVERSVSVVGARASTAYGGHVASELAYGLADAGWTVVSGGALGVDVAAHRGALSASGATVAVLACGIDRAYPAANAGVLEQIGAEGLLLTEWPPGTQPYKTRFLTRNRVIAAAARGTVMVEAGSRSGARSTLGYARQLGRSAMVVPGPVTSAMSVGCHIELRQAGTVLVTRAEEVIEEVGSVGELATPIHGAERPEDALDALQARVLDAVRPRRAASAEEIAARAGVSGRDARRSLPLLEELGFIVSGVEGYRLSSVPRPPINDEEGRR